MSTIQHGKTIRRIQNALDVANRHDPDCCSATDINVKFPFKKKKKKVKAVRPDVVGLKEVETCNILLGTLAIEDTGAKTVLAVEVTSPETRDNDLTYKVDYYLEGGVDIYLIVDYGKEGEDPPQLIGRRRVKVKWKLMEPNAQGLLDLDPFNLLIGKENEDLCFFRRDIGERIADVEEIDEERQKAKKRLKQLEALLRQAGIEPPAE